MVGGGDSPMGRWVVWPSAVGACGGVKEEGVGPGGPNPGREPATAQGDLGWERVQERNAIGAKVAPPLFLRDAGVRADEAVVAPAVPRFVRRHPVVVGIRRT